METKQKDLSTLKDLCKFCEKVSLENATSNNIKKGKVVHEPYPNPADVFEQYKPIQIFGKWKI